jgi:hypothetical protein
MNKFLYFRSDAGQVGAAFPVADVIAITTNYNAAGSVLVYFARGSGLIQMVELTVTLTKEEEVVKAIAQACGGMPNLKNAAIVVADDDNSTFLHSDITHCAAIDLDVTPSA